MLPPRTLARTLVVCDESQQLDSSLDPILLKVSNHQRVQHWMSDSKPTPHAVQAYVYLDELQCL